MKNKKKLCLILCLLLLLLPSMAKSQVYDTSITKLFNHYKYRETADIINIRLKNVAKLDLNTKLFYYTNLSLAQYKLGNIDSAKIYALKSLSLCSNKSDSLLIYDAWKVTAFTYNDEGKFDSAMYYTKNMLAFSKRKKDNKLYKNSLSIVASLLYQNKKYSEALSYYNEINVYNIKLKDSSVYDVSHFNLGITYQALDQYDSSYYHLNQAILIAKANNHLDLLTNAYGATADCYIFLKNRKEWKKYMLLANALAEQINNLPYMAMGYTNLLVDAVQYKEYAGAIKYGEKALVILKTNPFPMLQLKVDSMMYTAYKATGEYKKALSHLESYTNGFENTLNEKEKQQINELVIKYEVEKKDLIIANQNLEIMHKQRNQLILLLISVIIGLYSIWQIFYIRKKKLFRKELYLKEKDLDIQIKEVREWMESKYTRDVEKVEDEEETTIDENIEIIITEDITPKDKLYAELRELIEKDKLYLDPEIHLQTVIKKLGTNKKYLYEAMNHSTDNNFRTIINRYRVDEAKRIIEHNVQNEAKWVISELYTFVGFNSPVSFYRAFRSVIGLTPKEYLSQVKEEYKNKG